MSKKLLTACYLIMATMSLANTGCFWLATEGPALGILAIPLPVSPFLQDEQEDKFWRHERYDRAPILGPLMPGGPCTAIDPPSDDEVMKALEKARPVRGGVSLLQEKQRLNVRIAKDKISDYIDPPRVLPMIGPVQQHHAHYKCTVYYTEVTRVGWPVPYTTRDEDTQEVVYIDHNHLHMVGNVDPGPGANF